MPVGSSVVHTAKNGAKYIIMANGRARFVKSSTKSKQKVVHHRKSKK